MGIQKANILFSLIPLAVNVSLVYFEPTIGIDVFIYIKLMRHIICDHGDKWYVLLDAFKANSIDQQG